MRDPKWMGVAPTNYRWSADSKTVFFSWNPENKEKEQSYKVNVANGKPEVTEDNSADKAAPTNYVFSNDKSLGLFEKGGDVYLELPSGLGSIFDVKVFNQVGQIIKSFQMTMNSSQTGVWISTEAFTNGLHFIEVVSTDGEAFRERIIVR